MQSERDFTRDVLVNEVRHTVAHKVPVSYDARDMHLAAVVARLEELMANRHALAEELRALGHPDAARYVEERRAP